MKRFIKNFVKKTWLTWLGIYTFIAMFWIPPIIASIMSKGNAKSFDYYILCIGSIVCILWAIYFLMAWIIGLPGILQEYMDNHKNKQNYIYSGKYGREVKNLKEDISCAAISFFGCLIISIILIVACLITV